MLRSIWKHPKAFTKLLIPGLFSSAWSFPSASLLFATNASSLLGGWFAVNQLIYSEPLTPRAPWPGQQALLEPLALLRGFAVPAGLSLGHNYINHWASCKRGGHRQLQKMGFGVSNEQLIYMNTPGKAGKKKFYSLEHKLLWGRQKNFLHLNRNIYIMFNIFSYFLLYRKYGSHNLNKYLNIQCLFNWDFEWILLFYYQHLGSTSMFCIVNSGIYLILLASYIQNTVRKQSTNSILASVLSFK